MKYIKTFEQSTFTIEGYFQDKINWTLFRLIQDMMMSIIDKGHSVKINILVHYENLDNIDTIYSYISNCAENNGEYWVNYFQKTIMSNINDIERLEYDIHFTEEDEVELDEDDEEKIDKITELIPKKFNVTLNCYNDTDFSFYEDI